MNKLGFAAIAAVAGLLAAASLVPARGEEAELTVRQALNVGNGLSQLTKYETADKDGKAVSRYYKFSPDVTVAIAIDLDLFAALQRRAQQAHNSLVMQWSDGAGTVPAEKMGAFTAEDDKLMDAPSRVRFERLKLSDLRLEENPIPPPVLSLILPIVERGK